MDDNDLTDRLRRFGFSGKEIDTYLTVLEHGSAKASTIAEDSGVSKRYVYNIVEKFEDRGLVEVNDHVVPTMIEAKPPSEVVDLLQQELADMEDDLEDRYSETRDAPQQFEVIKSRATVHKRIAELTADAEEEVVLSIPAPVVPKVREDLVDTVERDVFVLVLVTGADGDAAEDEYDGLGNVVRTWAENAPMLLAADQRVGVFAPNELLAKAHSTRQALVLAQEQLVPTLIGSFLGNYWQVADEAYVDAPRDLPATYRTFRHAVRDATLHLRADAPIAAAFETPDGETVNARVVDVRQGLVEPTNNAFPVENTLVLETDDRRFTVGGEGAFIEDYEASEITFSEAETTEETGTEGA
ncbi:TrmB family transcriptional regulator [Halostella sp. JP-L12]|uniref:TrmB family transcriptional regulator n=1 Tax=Halostella TaxID=1843185 RepID=UPI000EF789AD|nr:MULTISPECIES: TrmB family transcriptional regulator sugar-binding domain-containing protein [Halostella]NHN48125.1 TrmB family transcriptional regulator [Halostella sp. JP-L12]